MERGARISEDGVYRYQLVRTWGAGGGKVLCFIMLNPSIATDLVDDPTVRLCIKWAMILGFDTLVIVNLFAYRATDPKQMIRMRKVGGFDIEGPENNDAIVGSASAADMVLCGWGANAVHPELSGRAEFVKAMLRKLGIPMHCLKLSKQGHPVHPLYQPYSLVPQVMQ